MEKGSLLVKVSPSDSPYWLALGKQLAKNRPTFYCRLAGRGTSRLRSPTEASTSEKATYELSFLMNLLKSPMLTFVVRFEYSRLSQHITPIPLMEHGMRPFKNPQHVLVANPNGC